MVRWGQVGRGALLSAVMAMAGGCVSVEGTGGRTGVPVDSKPVYTEVGKSTSHRQLPETTAPVTSAAPSAYRPLLDKAAYAATQGDYAQALALLERAQRIEPSSGEIYLNLAKTYRAKGDLAMAQATAERGLLYCSGRSECDALRAYVP